MPADWAICFWLMRGCGLRIGQALAVGEASNRGHVLRASEQMYDQPPRVGPLKHRKPGEYRDIPLPAYVETKVADHVKAHGTGVDGYYFRGRNQSLPSQHTVRASFARAAKKASLPPSSHLMICGTSSPAWHCRTASRSLTCPGGSGTDRSIRRFGSTRTSCRTPSSAGATPWTGSSPTSAKRGRPVLLHHPATSAASNAPSSQHASSSALPGVPVTVTGGRTGRQPSPVVMDSTARTAPPASFPPCTYSP